MPTTPRTIVALAALALAAGCAGFMDSRMLPWQPLVSRTLIAEEIGVVEGRRFTFRTYRELRAGMGELTATYVLADGNPRLATVTREGVEVFSGTVNGQLFHTNTPGEWYCGNSRSACIRALEPEPLPRLRGFMWAAP